MSSPFFSIVLPTKNRGELLSRSIQSVLSQDFTDYELIVVDNDDFDVHSTERIVSKYQDDHIKYFRTGNLSMSDNWSYGYVQAKGQHICLLRDKNVFLDGSLSRLHQLLSKNEYDIVSWNWVELMDETNSAPDGSGKVRCIPSKTMINMFLGMKHSDYSYFRMHLPKGSNSCISRKLYEKIVSQSGSICLENAPDYTQGYQILLNTDNIYVVDLNVTGRYNRDTKYGTGAQHDLGFVSQAMDNMGSKSTDISSIKYQPLKITNTETVVFEDFFRVAELYGGHYSFKDVNIRNYFKTIFRNTLGRQSYIYPENQEYFKNLKKTIRDLMRQTYSTGLKRDLFVCFLLDVFYYRFHRCGISTFRFMEKHFPSFAAFMWLVGERL